MRLYAKANRIIRVRTYTICLHWYIYLLDILCSCGKCVYRLCAHSKMVADSFCHYCGPKYTNIQTQCRRFLCEKWYACRIDSILLFYWNSSWKRVTLSLFMSRYSHFGMFFWIFFFSLQRHTSITNRAIVTQMSVAVS